MSPAAPKTQRSRSLSEIVKGASARLTPGNDGGSPTAAAVGFWDACERQSKSPAAADADVGDKDPSVQGIKPVQDKAVVTLRSGKARSSGSRESV